MVIEPEFFKRSSYGLSRLVEVVEALEHRSRDHHLETSSLHRLRKASHEPLVVFDDQHGSCLELAGWIQTLFLRRVHHCDALSLGESFNFACRVAELVKIPRTNFCLEFGFARRRTFSGMGHLARSAFEYV